MIRIFLKDCEKVFNFGFKTGRFDFPGVLDGVSGINDAPTHHFKSLTHFSSGIFKPLTIDFLIPGMDNKCNVS